MPLRNWRSLNPFGKRIIVDLQEAEEEEGADNLFDPEAGRASDNPFAHLHTEDEPLEEASSDEEVSKYVTGEQE